MAGPILQALFRSIHALRGRSRKLLARFRENSGETKNFFLLPSKIERPVMPTFMSGSDASGGVKQVHNSSQSMSDKRIQRKQFLAAMGAAAVGVIGAGKLISRRDTAKPSAVVAAVREGKPLPADHRAVARSVQS